ncbi:MULTISPECIES: hypothetical protein [unclassified Streptomyces]|uniref:hypothetical protein n=1 Tax=unclassified Streptomyces TaxID=2593676 RepID=UPI0004C79276|nr:MULTISPECIES: hypothetical protein [unclassified Streptomyces]KOV86116.1 hypothetical protein ADL02_19720 [Streptomyces sp. NRRL WC-3723]
MATIITYDAPGFVARVAETAGDIVCILATATATDRAIQARVRRLMDGQGIDCRSCRECPVGQAE